MFSRIGRSKFLAVFISAFLCLNLSGSLCLAYCQIEKAEIEHCPLSKLKAENCPLTKGKQAKELSKELSDAVRGHEIDCCTPAINYFAAPLEKHRFSFQIANLPVQKTGFLPANAFEKPSLQIDFSYQKPLYDHRHSRLKNCVFRI